jgi:hypothetical protein
MSQFFNNWLYFKDIGLIKMIITIKKVLNFSMSMKVHIDYINHNYIKKIKIRKNNRSKAKISSKRHVSAHCATHIAVLFFFFLGDDMVSTRSIQKEGKDSNNGQLLL